MLPKVGRVGISDVGQKPQEQDRWCLWAPWCSGATGQHRARFCSFPNCTSHFNSKLEISSNDEAWHYSMLQKSHHELQSQEHRKQGSSRRTFTFLATLSTVAKTQKQPKRASTGEWVSKMSYAHTMEYYSALNRKGTRTRATAWMNLEDIMLGEISQSRQDDCSVFSLVGGDESSQIQTGR